MSLGDLSTDNRVAGLKQVQRFARLDLLDRVYIAKDADEEITEKLLGLCAKHGIPYDISHTMHQIGNACDIEVGSSCAGLLKRQ